MIETLASLVTQLHWSDASTYLSSTRLGHQKARHLSNLQYLRESERVRLDSRTGQAPCS